MRTRPARRGFTLVESVVVAGVLSLIVVFTLGMIPSFKMSNRRANMELQAGALAQSTLERLRTVPFDAIATSASDPVVDDGVKYSTVIEESEPVVRVVGTTSQTISKKVRVVVKWDWSERKYETFRETVICKLPRS